MRLYDDLFVAGHGRDWAAYISVDRSHRLTIESLLEGEVFPREGRVALILTPTHIVAQG